MIKKRIFSALAALIFGICAIVPVYARPVARAVPSNVVIADFEMGEGGWSSNDAFVPIKITEHEGRRAASIELDRYHTAGWRGFMQNFTEPLDMFCYHAFSFMTYIEPVGEGETRYFAKATFRSESDEVEYRTETVAGEWTEVSFDISGLYFREEISSIEISFFADNELVENAPLEKIYIDDITCADPMDEEMINAYMCEDFLTYGCTLGLDDDRMLALEVNASDPTVEGDIHVRNADEKNAIRFVIDNDTDAKKMTVFYSDNGEFTTARRISLAAESGYAVYVFELTPGYRPTRLKLLFEGAKSGSATIISASMVSVYDNGIVSRGGVGTCMVEDGQIAVKGRVEYNTAVGFSDAKLALYELAMWEDERELSDKTPAATTAMSTRFEFYLPISETPDPTVKYAVALLPSDGGAPIIIDTAKYISNPGIYASASKTNAPASIKGLATDDVAFAKETGAESVVLDIYLDKLSSGKHTGYLHTVSGAYYYYDMDFVDALDTKIKHLGNSGIAVYLRLLAEDEGRLVSLRATTPDSVARSAAAVDFLSSRYNSTKDGLIAGFIIGKKIDLESEYNDMGGLTLDAYVGEIAKVMRLVSNTARMNNSSLDTLVSLSDTFFYDRYTEEHLHGELYDKHLFIESLSEAVSDGGELEWHIFWENDGFFSGERTDRISASNLYMLTDFIAECKDRYLAPPASVVYHYTPTEADMAAFGAIYAYTYYTALYDAQISGFVTSVDKSKLGEDGITLIKYIDTKAGLELTRPYLAYFEANAWAELVAGMTEAHTAPISSLESALTKERPDRIKGTATLWDFSLAHSALGWQKGLGCLSLTNTKNGELSSLEVNLDGSGSVIYPYDEPYDMSAFSHIALELVSEKDAEVTLIIGGTGFVKESRAELSPGAVTLVADITDIPMGAAVEYIELAVDTDKICIERIDVYSRTHTDEELAVMLSSVDTEGEEIFNPIWVLAIATLVISSIAAAILIARKERE